MSDNKRMTGLYYQNIVKFLMETLENKKEEYAKYKKWWSFYMRRKITKELEKLDKQIDDFNEKIAEYKKQGWIT